MNIIVEIVIKKIYIIHIIKNVRKDVKNILYFILIIIYAIFAMKQIQNFTKMKLVLIAVI